MLARCDSAGGRAMLESGRVLPETRADDAL
jgi:hypothetical protein